MPDTESRTLRVSELDTVGTGLRLYRSMVIIREVELHIERLHRAGRMAGSFHSSVGQEAAASGVCEALRPDDLVSSTHRGHGHALAKGVPVGGLLAELFGLANGVSGGRGGSMHLHHLDSGFLGQNAIVAGGMPWAAGAAWGARQQGRDIIGVSFFGDGAASQGLFYETLRLATLWNSPCLFVCENNGFAHSMPVERLFGSPGTHCRLVAEQGMKAELVDGSDVLKVHEVACSLVDYVRTGYPAFLEVTVGRVRAHSLNDPEYEYRDRDSGKNWLEENDPIDTLRKSLPDLSKEFDQIDLEVSTLISRETIQAESGEINQANDALRDVDTLDSGVRHD